ncbi:MAG: ADP-ribosylation factor-like protein [Promethearchaeota archaeon]
MSVSSKQFRIPGTSWLVDLNIPDTDNIILVRFFKNGNLIHNYFLEKDGNLREILDKFMADENIDIPENRIMNLVEDMQDELYDFQEVLNKSIEMKKKNVENMFFASELQNKKILLLGLPGAGKTTIYKVVFEGHDWWNLLEIAPTRGIERHRKKLKIDKDYNLFVWDLGGQEIYRENYRKDAKSNFNQTSTLIFIIDASDPATFDKARDEFIWSITELDKYSKGAKIFCLLHKTDRLVNFNEKIEGLKKFLMEKVSELRDDIQYYPTSVRDDSIFMAWENIFKNIIPKSNKLNVLAENLKDNAAFNHVIVLERRTGLPICESSSIFDDVVIIGSINKIWDHLFKVIKDLDLSGLNKILVETDTGILMIEEFKKNLILIIIASDLKDYTDPNNQKLIKSFINEVSASLS